MNCFNDYFRKEAAGHAPVKAVKGRFKIEKADSDKMQAFGWASVSISENGEQIEDWQGDMIDPEDLENAAYEYVKMYRAGGEMHDPDAGIVATLIESMVFTPDKMEALGISEGTLPVGWWIGFQVFSEETWKKVKDGTYSMFSIEGTAERVEVDDDDYEIDDDD